MAIVSNPIGYVQTHESIALFTSVFMVSNPIGYVQTRLLVRTSARSAKSFKSHRVCSNTKMEIQLMQKYLVSNPIGYVQTSTT